MPFTPSGLLVVPWGTFKSLFLAYFRHSFEICSLLAKNENMDSSVLKTNSSALGRHKWLLQAKSKADFFHLRSTYDIYATIYYVISASGGVICAGADPGF